MSDWDLAVTAFLESRRSEHTRRAYGHVLGSLVQVAGKGLGEIGKRDVASWANGMRGAGLAESTIGQRLAAVSSFFDYAADVYELEVANPARGRSLRGEKVSAYGNAAWLDQEQCQALLGAIERDTARGKRDYALFLGYLMLGRRNSEWRTVTVKDLAGGQLHWKGKGRKEGRAAMPEPVRAAVEEWLGVSGLTLTLALSLKGRGDRGEGQKYVFPGQDGRRPLSAEQVRNLLRKYVRLAGIEGEGIHVHSLRHSAAMLRKEAGEGLMELQDFLGHNNPSTTRIYVHALERRQDVGWMKVAELLGIG